MYLCLMEGSSIETVMTIAERAGLQVTRVSAAVNVFGTAQST
jgi:hypothetical protein